MRIDGLGDRPASLHLLSTFAVDGIARRVRAVLFDLDDTLVDRRAALIAWATESLSLWLNRAPTPDEIRSEGAWLLNLDRRGMTPRSEFLAAIGDRYRGYAHRD